MRTEFITKDQNGLAAVELGLILPVLILIIFGIIELGLLLYNQQVITNASREGARAGIVARSPRTFLPNDPEDPDPVDVKWVVNKWIADHLVTFGEATNNPPVVKIHDGDFDDEELDLHEPDESGYTWDNPCTTFRCPLQVTVEYDYDFLVLSIFGFGPKTLSAQTTMLME